MSEELNAFRIPANAIKSGRIFGIKWSHWIEAFVGFGAVFLIVWNINFTNQVKFIFISVIGIAVFVSLLRGIKGRTLTEFIFNIFKNFSQRKEYHLGGVDDDSRKSADKAQLTGESSAERFVSFLRQKNKELERRYGEAPETDSKK